MENLLSTLEIIVITVELVILALYMMENTDMQRKIVLNEYLVFSCAGITALYLIDIVMPGGTGVTMAIVLALLWAGCTYIWNRSLIQNKEKYGEGND